MALSYDTGMIHSFLPEALVQKSFQEIAPSNPTASVIIVSYNGWSDLERCLQSLDATEQKGFEIIVVDNCSFDGSPERLEDSFPKVRLVRSTENLGYGGGNNLGAREAKGRVLVFLNPDTRVSSGWLQTLVNTLDGDINVGMVTPRILLMNDPERVNTCGNDVHLSGITLCRGMGEPSKDWSNGKRLVTAVSGAAFAIRKELFEAVGGFDDTFFLYMEDTDLSLRLQLLGYVCIYEPKAVVYHDYELHFGPRKTFYQERNRYLMLLKMLRWPTIVMILPALLLSEIVTWGFVLLRDRARFRNKIDAYTWVFVNWNEIMEKRRQIQRLRRACDRVLLRRMISRLDFSQTGGGWITTLSHIVFDPLFFLCHMTALALVWW